jgi:hypothetical protein
MGRPSHLDPILHNDPGSPLLTALRIGDQRAISLYHQRRQRLWAATVLAGNVAAERKPRGSGKAPPGFAIFEGNGAIR